MNLRRYLLASASHLAIYRVWAAQARDPGASPGAAASATPSSTDRDAPGAEALAAVAAARGAE